MQRLLQMRTGWHASFRGPRPPGRMVLPLVFLQRVVRCPGNGRPLPLWKRQGTAFPARPDSLPLSSSTATRMELLLRATETCNGAGENRVLMEGTFTHRINTESSLWSLEPGKCVLVSAGCAAVRGRALPAGRLLGVPAPLWASADCRCCLYSPGPLECHCLAP